MEVVLRRIRRLENRVDSLIHKEEDAINKHISIIKKLYNVKETITTTLSNLNSQQRKNEDKSIK